MDYWQQQQQRKEGRTFSAASQQAMASHTRGLRDAATAFGGDQAEMSKHLSGLGSAWDIPQARRAHITKIVNEHRATVAAHVKALHTRADDLDRLWQDTGQGDPYGSASRSTGGIEYKAGAGGRSTFNEHLAERKAAAADRHAMKRIARLAPVPQQPPTVVRLRGPFVEATDGQVAGVAVKLAALELFLMARRPPGPGRF